MKKFLLIILAFMAAAQMADACTSMVVSAKGSATGRPLLWKHRDTGADNNFLARVEAKGNDHGYIALFNEGDSLLREAWMGMNDAGFAIMNTASYNLAPDTAKFVDQEAMVMSRALKSCTTVDDFERLLNELPKPLGVQANFGVIDAQGGAAYFETNDREYVRFDAEDTPHGVLVRTNFSFAGKDGAGSGYIRYNNALNLAGEAIEKECVSPWLLTEGLSRSFYHSLVGRDMYDDAFVVNQDFIPRDISTASIVVEGVNPGQSAKDMRMWANLGYAPCGVTQLVTWDEIPVGFGPNDLYKSDVCEASRRLRETTIPYEGGSGKKYIDMGKLRPINEEKKRLSLENYKKIYGDL